MLAKLNGVWVVLAGIALTILLPATIAAVPQARPVLQITEPSAGSIVNPGQTLTVTVTSPTPALFPEVALIGRDPIGFAGIISPLPGELSVPIPKDIDLGRYMLTVGGTPESGKERIIASVEIDVERQDFPVSMSASFSGIELDTPGEQIHLEVLADYSDGTTYRATSSSHISFSSANTEVATVDASGMVTAVAPGIGLITVKYALGDNKLSIGIPVQMPNPQSRFRCGCCTSEIGEYHQSRRNNRARLSHPAFRQRNRGRHQAARYSALAEVTPRQQQSCVDDDLEDAGRHAPHLQNRNPT